RRTLFKGGQDLQKKDCPLYRRTVGHLKADHSPLLHFGIFGAREGKTNRQGRKQMKFGANELEGMKLHLTQNPKLHPPIPIWGHDARLAGKQ
ncbi:hypothetical protein AVEN_127232-2-1, partial [Araneus ventricosus]